MKILMLLQKEFPPDIRVEKEVKALQKAGFEIHVLCRNRKKKKDEIIHGIYVDRLKPLSNIPILHSIVNFPLFLNPFWIRHALRIIKRENIDFIHAHDLPMMPLGLIVSAGKIPVFYDMHENYPAAMEIWNAHKPLSRLFKTHWLAKKLDTYCCHSARHIFVVVEEQKRRLVDEGIESEKITIVGNRTEIDEFLSIPVDRAIIHRYRDQFVILYTGSFSEDRGLEIPIRALKSLSSRIPNIKLVLVGDGPNRERLESLVKAEGISQFVEFTGWQPFRTIPSFIRGSSICIVPQPSNAFIDTTVPHKLFQYMALKKPVVVSDAKPLARWVNKLKAGEIFASARSEQFANSVLKIYNNDSQYYPFKNSEIFDVLDWKNDAANLVATYLQYGSQKHLC